MISRRTRNLLVAALALGQVVMTHIALHAPAPLMMISALAYIFESAVAIGLLFYLLQVEIK